MDHSLYAYLKRQSTEKLLIILYQHLQSPHSFYCEEIVCFILEALQEQEIELSDIITPEIFACWEENRRNFKV